MSHNNFVYRYNPWTFNHDIAVLRVCIILCSISLYIQVVDPNNLILQTAINFEFNLIMLDPPIAPALLNDRVIADAVTCFVVGFNAPTVGNFIVKNLYI